MGLTKFLYRHPDKFLAAAGFTAGFISATMSSNIWNGIGFGTLLALVTLWIANLDPNEHHHPKE